MANLLDFFVSFFAKGQEQVKAAMDDVRTTSEKAAQGINAVGVASGIIYAKLAESVGSYVRAGIAASAIGDQINVQMQQISLSIAGLFRPELEKLIAGLRAVTDWFRNLTDAQRENIVRWIEAAAVTAAVGLLLPKIVAGVQAASVAIKAMGAALAFLEASTGIGALLPIIGGIVAAFTAAGAGATVFQDGIGGLLEKLEPLWEIAKDLGASLFDAFKPLLDMLPVIFDLFVSILKPVFELIGAFVSVLAPIIKIIATLLSAIMQILKPIIDLFVKLAEVIVKIVKPVLDALAWVLGQIAKGLDAIFGSAEKGEKKSGGNRSPLGEKVGGPEDITAAFSKLNVASLNATAGIKADKSQEDFLEEIAQNTGREGPIVSAVNDKPKPPLAR